ncbi:MAG: UbiA family prenyltransferase [Thermoplasmata archaeon]|nr:UbiA family prenyltransferase [Thermoplasmata archaeon]
MTSDQEYSTGDKYKGFIELLRPGWWLACFFIGVTPGMLAITWDTGNLDEFLQWKSLLWIFGYWLAVIGIYVYNDAVGVEEDVVINPKRPIPSKRVSVNNALVASAIIVALGVVLFWFAFFNIYASLIQIACIVIMVIYSTWYKNNILLGAAAGLIPIGIWIGLAPIDEIPLVLFLIFFFWELTLDVPENLLHYEGDKRVHPQTFAINLGRKKFAKIGLVFAVPAVIAVFVLFILIEMSLIFLVFAIIASVVLLMGTISIKDDIAPFKLGRALGMAMLFILLINIGIISHTIVQSI